MFLYQNFPRPHQPVDTNEVTLTDITPIVLAQAHMQVCGQLDWHDLEDWVTYELAGLLNGYNGNKRGSRKSEYDGRSMGIATWGG